jgi:hypothetical protein
MARIAMVAASLATTGAANAAECRVQNKYIAGAYSGGCEGGYAEGRGIARGRDEYEGGFRQGKMEGQGLYRQSNGVIAQGEFRNDSLYFGVAQIPSSMTLSSDLQNRGKYINGYYVVSGLWKNDKLIVSCTTLTECEARQGVGGTSQGAQVISGNGEFAKLPMDALNAMIGNWSGIAVCKGAGTAFASVTVGMPRWIGFEDEWARRSGRPTRAERFPNRRQIDLSILTDRSDFLVSRSRWSEMVDGAAAAWTESKIDLLRRDGNSNVLRMRIERAGDTVQLIAFQDGCEPLKLARIQDALKEGDPVPGARAAGVYKVEDFAALKPWAETFEKAIKDPKGYDRFLAGLSESSDGFGSMLAGLLQGPARNHYQIFLTDLETYLRYTPRVKTLLERTQQCLAPRDYSSAEACDCMAGFPGDATIGPGAGELVVRSSANLVLRACGEAAQSADPRDRARFLAQCARAQLLLPNQAPAGEWARESMAAGYKRAQEIYVYAQLKEVEFMFERIPGPSKAELDDVLKRGRDSIAQAKALGIKGTDIMTRQFKQTVDRLNANQSIFGEIQKAIDTPPIGRGECQIAYMSTHKSDGSPKPVFECKN